MIVGNSLQPEIRPVVEAGGWGVHIPHDLTWAVEHDTPRISHTAFTALMTSAQLAALVTDTG